MEDVGQNVNRQIETVRASRLSRRDSARLNEVGSPDKSDSRWLWVSLNYAFGAVDNVSSSVREIRIVHGYTQRRAVVGHIFNGYFGRPRQHALQGVRPFRDSGSGWCNTARHVGGSPRHDIGDGCNRLDKTGFRFTNCAIITR